VLVVAAAGALWRGGTLVQRWVVAVLKKNQFTIIYVLSN